jgi:glucose-fructose oxidoreductase
MSELSRRQFIKLANAGIVSAGIAFNPFAQSRGNNNKVGVALVGLGYYSSGLLAPALQMTEHCELKGIVTGSPYKIPKWQRKYGIKDANVYSYENMHEIANNPDIDVVYVVVPTALHLKFCEIAANAGKHVWCEKPMAMTVAQCQRIIDVCKNNKVQLTVSYRMQHEPNTRALMAYKNSMPFGQYQSAVSRAGYGGNGMAADNWRMKKEMGGGAMYDMGVYPLNGTRFLTGMEPIAITARHEKSHPNIFKEVDETTFFTLEFANGLVADCATSVVKSFNYIRLECVKGWYELRPMSDYFGVTAQTSSGLRLAPIAAMQQTIQMDNDALAVKGMGPILVPGEEGMRDIHVVENAFKSAKLGKRVTL